MIGELQRDGIVKLPYTLDIDSINEYLSTRPVYQNHVRQNKPHPVPIGSHPWTCHDMGDVTMAPGFLAEAMLIRPIVQTYLETHAPYLYSLNAFYCEPTNTPKPDIQGWHRDTDDSKFLAMFVYGTDVLTDDDGPHQFLPGTHLTIAEGYGLSDTIMASLVTVYGPAGTIFLADTRGYHRGLVPKHNRRMLLWARWGVSCPPASYQWDGLRPLPKEQLGDRYPSDPALQEAIKLVVA